MQEIIDISTHAPTRGATDTLPCSVSGNGYFNPRSHKGSDCKKCQKSDTLFINFVYNNEFKEQNANKKQKRNKIFTDMSTFDVRIPPHKAVYNTFAHKKRHLLF